MWRLFIGVWTNTCCSHPLHVEDEMSLDQNAVGVRRAAERRLAYELGVPAEQVYSNDRLILRHRTFRILSYIKVLFQVSADKIHYITRLLYQAQDPSNPEWGEHELDYILFMRGDIVPFPNLNEVEATQYVSKAGLKLLLSKKQVFLVNSQFSDPAFQRRARPIRTSSNFRLGSSY